MNPADLLTLLAFTAEPAVVLADSANRMMDEVGLAAAVMLTVIGMMMFWNAPRHRMSVEEHTKDGDMTEDEARRQLRFYQWCAPIATTIGVVLLIVAIIDLVR